MKESNMPTIKIDDIDYDLDTLSQDAKAQLASIQFMEQELARLQAQAAALQTARNAYLQALKAVLPVLGASDTIKIS
jgi:cell division septum initiation protein DivIVA